MTRPTVGRVVWFYKHHPDDDPRGPLAAHVCRVWSDHLVNLMVISASGMPYAETWVQFIQAGEEVPVGGDYCCWMPHQEESPR